MIAGGAVSVVCRGAHRPRRACPRAGGAFRRRGGAADRRLGARRERAAAAVGRGAVGRARGRRVSRPLQRARAQLPLRPDQPPGAAGPRRGARGLVPCAARRRRDAGGRGRPARRARLLRFPLLRMPGQDARTHPDRAANRAARRTHRLRRARQRLPASHGAQSRRVRWSTSAKGAIRRTGWASCLPRATAGGPRRPSPPRACTSRRSTTRRAGGCRKDAWTPSCSHWASEPCGRGSRSAASRESRTRWRRRAPAPTPSGWCSTRPVRAVCRSSRRAVCAQRYRRSSPRSPCSSIRRARRCERVLAAVQARRAAVSRRGGCGVLRAVRRAVHQGLPREGRALDLLEYLAPFHECAGLAARCLRRSLWRRGHRASTGR